MAGSRNGTPKRAEEVEFPDNLRPVESRMYRLLSDGKRHRKSELKACLDDELADGMGAVRVHICNLRKKLPPERIILCEVAWMTVYYRMVCPLFPEWFHPDDAG